MFASKLSIVLPVAKALLLMVVVVMMMVAMVVVVMVAMVLVMTVAIWVLLVVVIAHAMAQATESMLRLRITSAIMLRRAPKRAGSSRRKARARAGGSRGELEPEISSRNKSRAGSGLMDHSPPLPLHCDPRHASDAARAMKSLARTI